MGGITHQVIIELLGVGATTIAYVDKWLNVGFGGYRKALKKNKEPEGKKNYKDDFDFSFSSLREKYPAHFWLINLFLDK